MSRIIGLSRSVPITLSRHVKVGLDLCQHKIFEPVSVYRRRHATHRGTILALLGTELDCFLEADGK